MRERETVSFPDFLEKKTDLLNYNLGIPKTYVIFPKTYVIFPKMYVIFLKCM